MVTFLPAAFSKLAALKLVCRSADSRFGWRLYGALRWWVGMAFFCLASAGLDSTANASTTSPTEVRQVSKTVEPHHRVQSPANAVALTLDACGGAFDQRLIQLLIDRQVSATLFVTKRWLDKNAAAVQLILQHPDLFELENHGTQHRPLVMGPQRHLYGMAGLSDAAALEEEVTGTVALLKTLTGRAPRYFRGAGAAYDAAGQAVVQAHGFELAGFSVNADAGATYPAATVAARLMTVRAGDVVIAHMNHPAGGTAEGFARALPTLQAKGLRFVKLSEATLAPLVSKGPR